MKIIAKITLVISILCLFAFAQTKPKAAVYIKGNPEGRDALRMAVNTFLIKSGKYQMIAVDAIDVVAKEQNRQRSGAVSNEDIALLGRDAGAQYVCVVERSESDGISYVSTSMVSVQSKIAELSEMSELPRGEKIINLIERQINSMLGIKPSSETSVEHSQVNYEDYSIPPEDNSSEKRKQSIDRSKRIIRLGARWRGGWFRLASSDLDKGTKLFDKSYDYKEMEKKAEGGYNLYLNPGLTLEFKITDMIAVVTELSYDIFFGYDFWYGGNEDNNFIKVSISHQTIEVPALFRLTYGDREYFEAGFQWGFPVSSEAIVSSGNKFTDSSFKYEYSDFRPKTNYSSVIGFGSRFSGEVGCWGLRFTFPLTKLDRYGTINTPIIVSLTFAIDFI